MQNRVSFFLSFFQIVYVSCWWRSPDAVSLDLLVRLPTRGYYSDNGAGNLVFAGHKREKQKFKWETVLRGVLHLGTDFDRHLVFC